MSIVATYQDPRKRRDALAELIDKAASLEFKLYPELCEALHDDYEHCRMLAIKLVVIMSSRYKDTLILQRTCEDQMQVRLEDDAFARICRMATDPAVQVRVEAVRSVGLFKTVSLNYQLATLDKKDELSHSGTFVFGLEDERKDVRMAALDSLCQLSKMNPKFAERSLDLIVDMFNDEIQAIRLKAIECLQDIDNVALRDEQVEVILTALDSPSMDIREALHRMLARVNISSARSLRRIIELVLSNLSRYPQDRSSIFNFFKNLGQHNPEFVASLINELLAIHPYLKLPEHSLIDDNYIATLILIFNASANMPSILDSLESHTLLHQTYAKHTVPNFMPHKETPKSQSASANFFVSIFDRLGKMLKSGNTQRAKASLLQMSLQDLRSFGLVEPEFRASTEFYRNTIESILTVSRLLSTSDWMDLSSSLRPIRKVLDQTFALLRRYHKLSPVQGCCIRQLRVIALAIELIVFINSSNASALDLCDSFMEEVKSLESYMNDEPFLDSVALASITSALLEELSLLDQPKPGTVARKIEPMFCEKPLILNQVNEILTTLIDSQNIDDLEDMKLSSATFNNMFNDNDSPFKFTAGLVLALTIDVIVENVTSTDHVRVKVVYPDKLAHIVVPVASHFRLLSGDSKSETSSYRLYSTVNICHNTWTEPSSIELSMLLDYRDNQSTVIQLSQSDYQTMSTEESQTIEISQSLVLRVHPQGLKW